MIESLQLKGVAQYRSATVPFEDGLVLIRGRNNAGKSSLLDGLIFALFGDAGGVRPHALFSRLPGIDEMTTIVAFKSPVNGQTVSVMRKGRVVDNKYNSTERLINVNNARLNIVTENEVRDKINELLGVPLRRFLVSSYVRQGELTGILSPQKETMDLLLKITLFREIGNELDETKKSLAVLDGRDIITVLAAKQDDLEISRAMYRQLEDDIRDLTNEKGALEPKLKMKQSPEFKMASDMFTSLEGLANEEKRLLDMLNEGLDKYQGKKEVLTGRLGDVKARKLGVEKETRDINTEAAKAQEDLVSARSKLDAITNELGEMDKLKEGVTECPTCHQPLTLDHLKRLQKLLAEMFDARNADVTKARAVVAALAAKLETLNTDNSDLTFTISNFERELKEISDIETRIAKVRTSITTLTTRLNAAGEPLGLPRITFTKDGSTGRYDRDEVLSKNNRAYTADVAEVNELKQRLNEVITSLQNKMGQAAITKARIAADEAVINTIKQRQLAILAVEAAVRRLDEAVKKRRDVTLKEIGRRAYQYYLMMTDQNVYNSIMIDPETYEVYVSQKNLAAGRISATRLGGGHQTLIALAVRVALIDIMSPGQNHVLILDEPTYGVDEQNIPQLANYLSNLTKVVHQVILVTHYNICEESANSIIDVSIANGESTIAVGA